jgi:guanine deaminase
MIEAETAVIHGRVLYDVKLPIEWVDGYYRTVIMPGFTDGHMHPQVIDPGISVLSGFSNSYEWIEKRIMAIDEGAVRRDESLSSRLTFLALLRSVLEGTTLVSITGAFKPNVMAWSHMLEKPRTVFLPTTMRRQGWLLPQEIFSLAESLRNSINDSLARLGIFVHSIKYSSPSDLVYSYRMIENRKEIIGLHLSEGTSEIGVLRQILGRNRFNRIIAVHCINDKVKHSGLSCISCPGTNIILYGKTKKDIYDIDSFGSDWPHLIGTVGSHVYAIKRFFNVPIETLFFRLTTGGYIVHGMHSQGDLLGFDSSLDDILQSPNAPVDVYVSGRKIVEEKQTVFSGFNKHDIERETIEVVKAAVDLHGTGLVTKKELLYRLNLVRDGFLRV